MQLASILQVKPAVVSEILAELQEQSLIAASPARQLAQVAIALRCGNSVKGGISHLQALSLPVAPVKLYGLKESFSALPETGSPGRQLLHGYEGFRTPCSLLNELPELHSFVDLFEQLVLGSFKRKGDKSILESEGVEVRTAVIFEHTAQVTFEHGQRFRESVKYVLPEEISETHKDIAQFTGWTISLLANLTDKPLTEL